MFREKVSSNRMSFFSFDWYVSLKKSHQIYLNISQNIALYQIIKSCNNEKVTKFGDKSPNADKHACKALVGRLIFHSPPLAGWEPIPELLEVFQTEFALRLFWGQTGAKADRKERYAKFDRILTVLSNKLEPDGSSEV